MGLYSVITFFILFPICSRIVVYLADLFLKISFTLQDIQDNSTKRTEGTMFTVRKSNTANSVLLSLWMMMLSIQLVTYVFGVITISAVSLILQMSVLTLLAFRNRWQLDFTERDIVYHPWIGTEKRFPRDQVTVKIERRKIFLSDKENNPISCIGQYSERYEKVRSYFEK